MDYTNEKFLSTAEQRAAFDAHGKHLALSVYRAILEQWGRWDGATLMFTTKLDAYLFGARQNTVSPAFI